MGESNNDKHGPVFESQETSSFIEIDKELIHDKDVYVQMGPLDEAKIAKRSRLGRRSREGDLDVDLNISLSAESTSRTRPSRKTRESIEKADFYIPESPILDEVGPTQSKPSRRIKEAAAVYTELIGQKMLKETKQQEGSYVEEEAKDDEHEDNIGGGDDTLSVSSLMNLKLDAKEG